MIHYIYGHALNDYPTLRDTMFADRADQFHTRLGWDVQINENGHEVDQYDGDDTLYVIWEQPDGSHGGSMRFLPTTGPVMVNDFFSQIMGGRHIVDPSAWECTRFCLARNAEGRVAATLMLAGCELGLGLGLRHSIGVFDARMVRIYRRLGWSPEVLGTSGEGRDAISVGRWAFSEDVRQNLCRLAGVAPAVSRGWFERTFGDFVKFPKVG